ncbi:MAG: hypothetical protein A2Y61_03955 [Chloroflexi bacterium RBG_13_60_13]|nr:MAG: hypothetical protein A2Y61_03955 [Chloroflexi bacterium RBG_13_60_13]
MPKVRILSRSAVRGLPGESRQPGEVNVIYSSQLVPPRSVFLRVGSYREATGEELKVNARLAWVPKDQAAQDAELAAIGEDLAKVQVAAPPTFDVP